MAITESTLAPIERDAAYPLPLFSKLTGLGEWGVRRARARGLRVRRSGRRKYVLARTGSITWRRSRSDPQAIAKLPTAWPPSTATTRQTATFNQRGPEQSERGAGQAPLVAQHRQDTKWYPPDKRPGSAGH